MRVAGPSIWRQFRTLDFWEVFHGNFIYSQSFCQKPAERKSPKKYFHIFVLMPDLGYEPGGSMPNNPTHFLPTCSKANSILSLQLFNQYYRLASLCTQIVTVRLDCFRKVDKIPQWSELFHYCYLLQMLGVLILSFYSWEIFTYIYNWSL